ncbi:MAG: hypothetical protein EOM20_10865 [Spartobacteria bacterium]|nr:hypothetical protein [Spartobacteria bacterium]
MNREQATGYGALVLSIVLFSTVEVSSKLLGAGLPPFLLAAVRFMIAGLVLLVPACHVLRLRKTGLGWRDAAILLGLALIGVTVSIGLYHLSILYLQANIAAIIFSANPVFVVMLAPFILRERFTWQKTVAALCGLCGIIFFAVQRFDPAVCPPLGLALMTGALITFALYTVLSRRVMPRYGALVITSFAGLLGSFFLFIVSFIVEGNPLPALAACSWGGILYLSVFATAIAYWAFFFGVIEVGASKGSMFFFLKPFLASLFAWLALGEKLTSSIVIGGAFVLAGLFFAVGFPSDKKKGGIE